MSCLIYKDKKLWIEAIPLDAIAQQMGTPCYAYSHQALQENWQSFHQAFSSVSHLICYAVKANSNLSILKLFSELGSGFDIVSLGELERVLKAGGKAENIIFSGVGKTEIEIEQAIKYGIYCFNTESESEIVRINHIAKKLKKIVNISFRINPDIPTNTHAYISTGLKENKFGIDTDDVIPLCEKVKLLDSIKLIGIGCHIGSQIMELDPFLLAADYLARTYHQLTKMGFELKHLDIGGGLGITYEDEEPPKVWDYAQAIIQKLAGIPAKIIIEPGRAIVGNAGVLLTTINYLKHHHHKNFAIIDAGMNDLLRPALYQAWQAILPTLLRDDKKIKYDIVGPVCESADFLGKDRELCIQEGDLLAIDSAGAYGFSMSSNYNSRPRAAEVMVEGDKFRVVRKRETYDELMKSEII